MLTIYTDGASKGNPGKAGWGVVVTINDQAVHEQFGYNEHATNNVVELTAIKQALMYAVGQKPTHLTIRPDSQYCIDSMTKWIHGWKRNGWKTSGGEPVKNQDLIKSIDALMETLKAGGTKIEFVWVKGHASHKWNERADQLANLGVELQKGSARDIVVSTNDVPTTPTPVAKEHESDAAAAAALKEAMKRLCEVHGIEVPVNLDEKAVLVERVVVEYLRGNR